MSKNQSGIPHPLPSQSDNNNKATPHPPPPPLACGGDIVRRILYSSPRSKKIILCSLGLPIVFTVAVLLMRQVSNYAAISDQTTKDIKSETVFFHIVNASLAQFGLTDNNNNNNTLDYQLTVDINVTNPNKDYIKKIEYDGMEVGAYYQDNQFDSVNLTRFYQDTKNKTTSLHAVFQGQDSVPGLQSDRFYRDKSDGNFDIQLQLSPHITYHYENPSGQIFRNVDFLTVKCDLRMRVPLFNLSSSSSSSIMNGTSTTMIGSGGFLTKECKVSSIIKL